jgi:glutathione S-transferase
VDVTYYGMRISHPARAGLLMLRHKGVEARLIDIPPGAQQIAMRAYGFRGGTVPGMKIDGRRVQGSAQISRALEEAVPDPPLFPADPERRAAVEEAERWGDDVFQPVPRRIFRWSVVSNGAVRQRFVADAGLPVPPLTSRLLLPPAYFYMRLEGGGEEAARADTAALPRHLDHVDELIASGVIDGEELNAADFQIAVTTRILLNFKQLRPLVEGRPAAAHAVRVAPNFGTNNRAEIPDSWIPSVSPA